MMILLPLLFVSGCAVLGTHTQILTSDEELFSIVEGSKLTVVRNNKPTEIIAPAQLITLYKGNLLKQEKEANSKAVKGARAAKKQGAWLGAIGSLLAIVAGLFGKAKLKKKE